MKLLKSAVLAGALACALATGAVAQGMTVLSGATIIDGTGAAYEAGVIIVEDGRIACIGDGETCPVPAGAEVHDVSGKFITPGLVDAHVHFAQTGWLDGRPDGIEALDVYPYSQTVAALKADPGRWHRAYLCSGITAVYDVGGQDWTVTGTHASDTNRADRVHVRAAGPLLTHASARNRYFTTGDLVEEPLFLPFDSDEEVREGVARLQSIGAQAVKVWFLRPTEDRREELEKRLMLVGELAREAGLPLIVHSTGLREAKAALRAGANMLVHSVDDALVDDEFIDMLLANKTVYSPTLFAGRNWVIALGSVVIETPVEIDDPNNCVDPALRERIAAPERLAGIADDLTVGWMMRALIASGREIEVMSQNLATVHDAGGHIVVATDAGNPLTLHGPSIYAEMEAMQAAGMTSEEVIEAATISGARAIGRESEIGSLEPGKMADLLVLDQDPREDVANFRSLTHVMRRGVLRTQEELRVTD